MASRQRLAGVCWVLTSAVISSTSTKLSWFPQFQVLQSRPAFVAGGAAVRRRPRVLHTPRRQQLSAQLNFIDTDLESLDAKQQEAVDAVLAGENVFITGGAGTGKSRTLKAIIAQLRWRFGEDFRDRVAVTATTGTAAINVGGCTLHHLAGLRIPREVKDFKQVGKGLYKRIWQELEVLVIDEASMLSGEFFDRLETELERIRDGKPLQLVLVGDLWQLPPITEKLDKGAFNELEPDLLKENRAVKKIGPRATYEYFLNRGMIFQSQAFWEKSFRVVELTTQHRQSSDATLAQSLFHLRSGAHKGAISTLNKHCYWPFEADRKDATTLVPTRRQANDINGARLASLEGEVRTYTAKDDVLVGTPPENLTETEAVEWTLKAEQALKCQFFSHADAEPSDLSLKVGALVMLTSTVDQFLRLVNGQTGTVVELGRADVTVYFPDLRRRQKIPFHKFESQTPGLGACVRWQIPLRLAWAVTHHRSQGKTLKNVVVDPRSFECGQAYVALSRACDLEGLRLKRPIEAKDVSANTLVSTFEQLLRVGAEPEHALKELKTWRQLPVSKGHARRKGHPANKI